VIVAGTTIENPVTGETLVFHETSHETNGERLVFETIVRPGGVVASAHIHPYQEERFAVLEGHLGMKVGRVKTEYSAGEAITIPAGTPHKFWNAGDDELRFLAEVRPALAFESLIETMFGLAADGKVNGKGMPNPLRLAVIAKAHFDVVRLPGVPSWLQRAALAMGAPVGRLAGFTPTYASQAAPEPVYA
jgi:mannose-6-phosphate isomerase-like protein (cupin superfamily)